MEVTPAFRTVWPVLPQPNGPPAMLGMVTEGSSRRVLTGKTDTSNNPEWNHVWADAKTPAHSNMRLILSRGLTLQGDNVHYKLRRPGPPRLWTPDAYFPHIQSVNPWTYGTVCRAVGGQEAELSEE